ncbi:hypothetical protein WP1_085 [Pseudomonas phage WP1]
MNSIRTLFLISNAITACTMRRRLEIRNFTMLKPAAVGFPNNRYFPETVTCGYPDPNFCSESGFSRHHQPKAIRTETPMMARSTAANFRLKNPPLILDLITSVASRRSPCLSVHFTSLDSESTRARRSATSSGEQSFAFFPFSLRWTEWAMATACFGSFPASISPLMFSERASLEVPMD